MTFSRLSVVPTFSPPPRCPRNSIQLLELLLRQGPYDMRKSVIRSLTTSSSYIDLIPLASLQDPLIRRSTDITPTKEMRPDDIDQLYSTSSAHHSSYQKQGKKQRLTLPCPHKIILELRLHMLIHQPLPTRFQEWIQLLNDDFRSRYRT